MRSRIDRRVAGVCGGLAQHLGWDSTLIRVLWVCLVLFGGTGLLAYVVLWVVIPEEAYGLPPYAGYAPPPQAYPGNYPGTQAGPYAGGASAQVPPQYPGGQTYAGPGVPPQQDRSGF